MKIRMPSGSGARALLFCFILFGKSWLPPAAGQEAAGPLAPECAVSTPIDISDDGELVLMELPGPAGFEVANTRTGRRDVVSSTPNTGYFATISPDKRFVCYKDFQDVQGRRLQIPALYDIATKEQIPLSAPVQAAGNPVASTRGQIACTIGEHLFVWNSDWSLVREMDLGAAINVLSFSPDGRRLAFGEPDGTISWVDVERGTRVKLPKAGIHGYQAHFSPDGQSLLARNSRGEFSVCHLATGAARSLGNAVHAAWADDNTVALVQKSFAGQRTTETRLLAVKVWDGSISPLLSREGAAEFAIKPAAMAMVTHNQIMFGKPGAEGLKQSNLKVSPPSGVPASQHALGLRTPAPQRGPSQPAALAGAAGPEQPLYATTNSSCVQLVGMPYINQVYDTPDNFSAVGGGSCCNVTSTLMAILYFGRLPIWPTVCSGNGRHYSYYGNYIPNVFTANGYTYNIVSSAVWGSSLAGWYGGFGYFLQDPNGTPDIRSGRLSQWISNNNITSSTDNNVANVTTGFTKAQAEIDANHPFVMLNSITTAGHYIACIGYAKSQYTLIFNDPYGNKNISYPDDLGAGAWYDWPGYNNGYQNLNNVWTYIYARGSGGQPGVYWDPYGASSNPTPNGTWDTTSTIWSCVASGTSATGPWCGPVAIFSAGSGGTGSYTVTVSGVQTVNHILVQTGNPTFTGGQINFDGAGNYFSNYVASGCTATYNTPFGGSGSPDKWGPGTAVYNGASTSTGYYTLNEGTLALGNNAALGGNWLAVGDTSGANVVTLKSADNNPHTLANRLVFNAFNFTIGSGGDLTFTGPIDVGPNNSAATAIAVSNSTTTFSGVLTNTGGLGKTGPGMLVLSGSSANTYGSTSANGNTSVSGGTLKLSKTGGALAVANGSLIVKTGGTLLLGAANQIGDAVPMNLFGGVFQTAGFSEQLGTLTLTANSQIDLGSGASVLAFAASSSANWSPVATLTITNWNGSLTGGGAERVLFGSSSAGLTAKQLNDIRFANPPGFPAGSYAATILSTGEVVPVTAAPVVTTQPTNRVAVVGDNIALNAVASGVPAPAYQWQFYGTNLPGANGPTLALNGIGMAQAGTYCVAVTNLVGTNYSSNATVMVYPTAAPTLSGAKWSADGRFQLDLAGVPGYNYAVLVSTNLSDWTVLQTTNSPFTFSDTNTAGCPCRFYRAQHVP